MSTLGLLMIVREGARTLGRALASVRGLVDTMIIGDTGSSDGTAELAAAMGAQVLRVPWAEDFAAARNAVLAALRTDWVLTLDADEEVAFESHAWIRSAIEAPAMVAYLVQVRNYLCPRLAPPSDQVMLPEGDRHPQAPDAVAYFPSACCRLFRRRPGIVYTGCVHEMVDYCLPPLGHGVEPAGFVIHHFGWYLADAARTAKKRELYRELLAKKLTAMPKDTNTLVRYAVLLAEDCGRLEEALAYLRRAAELDGSAPGAWLFAGMVLRRMGRFDEALVALAQVPIHDHPAFRAQLEGDAMHGQGRFTEARARYGEALRLAPLDRLVAAKLGLLETRTGAVEAGLVRMYTAVDAAPHLLDAEEMLLYALLRLERPGEARAQAVRLATRHHTPEAWTRMARVFAGSGDWQTALLLVDEGLQHLPWVVELHRLRLHAGVALGRFAPAAEAAEQIVLLEPSARAYLRLAAVLTHGGRRPEAEQALARGLAAFPGDTLLTGGVAAPEMAPCAG